MRRRTLLIVLVLGWMTLLQAQSRPDQQYQLSLGPGFYITEISLAPGAGEGTWGLEVLPGNAVLSGGFNLGGGLDSAGSQRVGFAGFNLDRTQVVTADLNAQALPGESGPALSVHILNSARTQISSDYSGPPPIHFSQSLAAGFYIVEIASLAGRGTYQLGLSAQLFTGGVDVGGFLTNGLTGFGAFNLPTAQSVTINLYSQSYGSQGAGPLNARVLNQSRQPVWTSLSGATQHYEYVFPDGQMYVYDMDNAFKLVKQVSIPQTKTGVRGVVFSPQAQAVYISYGGDGDGNGNGSMLAYDLLSDQVMWSVNYPFGIDSMAITPDGKTIYMPTGELSSGNTWNVLDASNGAVVASIAAGAGPHNTIVSLDGTQVYMGPRQDYFLYVASTATNKVIRKIGPLVNTVRPFTINGRNTLAYTTATAFLGFQVSDITNGNVLYTVPIAGFSIPQNFTPSTPSHGISLSPDEKEIWVMDAANSYVHVFDVSGVPASPPVQVADLPLSRPMTGIENPCYYDCARDGWVQHSRDGRFVFIGDSGDVINTATRQTVTNLDPLYNTRKHIEIDWQNGVPVSSTSRSGVGYVLQ